jgi:uncharacterized protein YegP (UPF0339 family)
MKIEAYGQAAKTRWRTEATNGQTVSSSGDAFSSHGQADRAGNAFEQGAAKANFEVYADRGGTFRWRATARNGHTVASSGESFANRSNAKRAAENVQAKARGASAPQ